MHKITTKEFTLDDFSCEHLLTHEQEAPIVDDAMGYDVGYSPKGILGCWIIPMLNECRDLYLQTKDKKYWWQLIQLLPTSYNQKRTVMLNYEVLHNIYYSRKDHKLDEWKTLCDWIKELPYSELIINEGE